MKISEVTLKYKTSVPIDDMPTIQCSEDAMILLRPIFDEYTIQLREEFVIILLNSNKRCLGWSKISIGGSNATIVDPATIFQLALLGNAQSVILAHNHPSGNLNPSTADIHLTRRVAKAGGYLSIKVDDHIIITQDSYYSFREKGLV